MVNPTRKIKKFRCILVSHLVCVLGVLLEVLVQLGFDAHPLRAQRALVLEIIAVLHDDSH